jgi:hypothetical protein
LSTQTVADFLKATLFIYWDSAVLASRGIVRNWLVPLCSVALFVIYYWSARFFSDFGLAGGMIAGMIQIALLCVYYSWISDTVQKERIQFSNLLEFDFGLFFNIISVAFIFFIVQLLLGQLTQGIDASFFLMCVQITLVLLFNPIPEVIYLRRIESGYALSEAARFTLANWIEWYLPLIILVLPWLLASPATFLAMLAGADPLLPPLVILKGVLLAYSGTFVQGVLPILAIIIANWFMFFRGHLFQALESGTRRQRIYKNKSR